MYHLECPHCKVLIKVNARLEECPGWRLTCLCGCSLLLAQHELMNDAGECVARWFYLEEDNANL